jgi:hypothetical protein
MTRLLERDRQGDRAAGNLLRVSPSNPTAADVRVNLMGPLLDAVSGGK